MRGSSLARQQRLVRLLDQGGGLSVPRTAADMGCTERTVYRDLVVLQEIGVPVYQEREGKRKRWRMVDGPRRRLSLTLSFTTRRGFQKRIDAITLKGLGLRTPGPIQSPKPRTESEGSSRSGGLW
jgi:HTH domain